MFADYVGGSPPAVEILGCRPEVEHLLGRARECARKFPRERVCGLLRSQAERHRCSETALRNIDLLMDPRTRVVVCSHSPEMLGGPLSNMVQALSAVKLAEALAGQGVPSIPLLALDASSASVDAEDPVGILDQSSTFRALGRECVMDESGGERLHWVIPGAGPARERLRDIPLLRRPLEGTGDWREAWGRIIAALAGEQGLVVVDPAHPEWRELARDLFQELGSAADLAEALSVRHGELHSAGYAAGPAGLQKMRLLDGMPEAPGFPLSLLLFDSLLPVGAVVLHPAQFAQYALVKPILERSGSSLPPAWPRASISLVDARTRKIMRKNEIGLADILREGAMLAESLAAAEDERLVSTGISRLEGALNSRISDVLSLSGAGGSAAEAIRDAEKRIEFQLDKLRRRFHASFAERRGVVRRQMMRVINTLVPGERLQEDSIWGLHFVLNYSPAVLDRMRDNIDVLRFEHRMIDVD